MSHAALMVRMRMLQARYGRMLDQCLASGEKKCVSLAKELNRQWVELWAYLYEDGAEPTNNAGERKIRTVVLWRKGSFGTWSDKGQRFVARSFSLAATAAQLGVNLLTYIQVACDQHILGQVVTSLHDWAASLRTAEATP